MDISQQVVRRYEKIYTEERREGRSSMEIESPQWLTPGALLSGSPYHKICVLIQLYMRLILVYMRPHTTIYASSPHATIYVLEE
jgi:hypothetical protein